TGVPGAGKSTFIDALGSRLVEAGRRIAVLAVDPTSHLSGGSILGDKTRMPRLASEGNAFVRPSPSMRAPGGVAPRTREVILLCEAAGYDTVFVETVGVGQAETAVHSMVDFFLLLALAGAGDELQGIKRGIVEMADAIAITKADGENVQAARRARVQYRQALRLFPPADSGWEARVLTCSSVSGEGVGEIWQAVTDYVTLAKGSGYFERRRKDQSRAWLDEAFEELVRSQLRANPTLNDRRQELERLVLEGKKSPSSAALDLTDELFRA
ncbi:MAG: methylmalonyl Co-A mutase-associated GTPase MeaB, partial [Rhodothermales bacterium]